MYSSSPALEASNFVSTFNTAFYFIVGVSLVLLIGLTITMIYFVYRYNRKRNPVATQIEGNFRLELIWTITPIVLSMVMFYFGWAGWKPMSKAPKDSMNITSIGRMWNFLFVYENGKQSPDLIVPLNYPVNLKLVSVDVIHSLFIPEFRIKSDMIPGREKSMWFLPQVEGEYKIFCAEYCGVQHSFMHSNVKVVSKEEFDKWYVDSTRVVTVTADAGPGAEGEAIMKALGCFACHTPDGTKLIGPSYRNLFGEQQVVIRNGSEVTITVDDDYVRKSILEPNTDITKGYPGGLMQSYSGTITDTDIDKIIEYLKSVSDI